MMPDIKQEPIENSPEMNWGNIPEIKSETIEYSPSSKRLKTLSSDLQSTISKGKSIIAKEDDDDDESQEVDTCGVCLLDEGMCLRGFIDSCDHYFCFVCIMEWAKVESRCPICKRRFSNIRRPSKDGVFFSDRIVNVPVRDQMYNGNGNATIGPRDPYSQTKCSVCSGSSDDHLLLLCDLCDSAAHSYCVGLGNTVPEDDWFCRDCTLSRDEHAKVETDTISDDNNNNINIDNPSRSDIGKITCSEVSIHDIVRDSSVIRTELTRERSNTRSTVDGSNAPNARTLKRCLNVHSRIRVLRENWDGFRGGAFNFSSRFQDGLKTDQSRSTSLHHESTSQNRPYDIDKAWKMMDIAAKALGKKHGNKKSVPKDSEFHKKKERLLNEASKVRPNSSYFGGLKRNERGISSSGKIIPSAHVNNNVNNNRYTCQIISTASNVAGSSDHSSSIATDKRCVKKAIDATLERVGSSDQSSSSMMTDKHYAKKAIDATLEKKENIIKKETQFDGNIREIEDAKSEIRSLVKLNLKVLSKDKKLEVDAFKEAARHATHSIMAACGIEPPKARFRSFERLVCDHSRTQKRPSSTLMPTCCRECFFIFVKDVVTTIAFDRPG